MSFRGTEFNYHTSGRWRGGMFTCVCVCVWIEGRGELGVVRVPVVYIHTLSVPFAFQKREKGDHKSQTPFVRSIFAVHYAYVQTERGGVISCPKQTLT
jgi:hypothetical protein